MQLNFRAILWVFTTCLLLHINALAQPSSKISGDFAGTSFDAFVKEVEAQVPYHFYYNKKDLDSFTVNVKAVQLTVSDLLQKVFAGTHHRFAFDAQGNIFITQN